MTIAKWTLVGASIAVRAAYADPMPDPAEVAEPARVENEAPVPAVAAPIRVVRPDPFATTERWGAGLRLTGLSGIGALPGVNFGAEVAGHLRHREYFAELALSRWKPEHAYAVVAPADQRIDLGLDVWTVRAGWDSMKMPLRAWVLGEVGEVAGPQAMVGVVPRMVMGDTPQSRQWRAVGAGFGVAWPISNQIRVVGNLEIAVPLHREPVALERYGDYQPDAMAARYSIGVEVGAR